MKRRINASSTLIAKFKTFKTEEGKKKAEEWGGKKSGKEVSEENEIKIGNWAYGKNPKAAELGNTEVADGDLGSTTASGYKYRGRGMFQLTGKSNYESFQKWYDDHRVALHLPVVDFVADPDKLLEDEYIVLSAIYFWQKHKLADIADLGVTEAVTLRISNIVNSGEDDAGKTKRWNFVNSSYTIVQQRIQKDPVGEMISPFENPYIVSEYDLERMHPIEKIIKPHRGADIVGPTREETIDKPVVAPQSGEIIAVSSSAKGGNIITLFDDNGYTHKFMHLKDDSMIVTEGQYVRKGDQLAIVGATGGVTGVHLHYEIWNIKKEDIDPRTINPAIREAPTR